MSNCDGVVPRITDSALHSIPARTSESFMIGSAALAVAGSAATASSVAIVVNRTLIAARLSQLAADSRS